MEKSTLPLGFGKADYERGVRDKREGRQGPNPAKKIGQLGTAAVGFVLWDQLPLHLKCGQIRWRAAVL